MKYKFVTAVDYFLFFMLIVKFIFLITATGHVVTIYSKNPSIQKHEQLLRKISETSEMIFIFGMSAFLIYHFSPSKKTFEITVETAFLLFAYGIVMFLGALKKYHVTPSPVIKQSQQANQQISSQQPSR